LVGEEKVGELFVRGVGRKVRENHGDFKIVDFF
jgi:hypothetical protein